MSDELSSSFGGWIDRDGKTVFLEKTVRTVPYGFLGVIFGVYLAQLGFGAFAIGVVLTFTVLSSAFYTFVVSFIADRIGRRRTLIFFALTDFIAGSLLFLSTAWWAPVLAGIVGNMTVGAGEVGPFLSLEQAILLNGAHSLSASTTWLDTERRLLGLSSQAYHNISAQAWPDIGPYS